MRVRDGWPNWSQHSILQTLRFGADPEKEFNLHQTEENDPKTTTRRRQPKFRCNNCLSHVLSKGDDRSARFPYHSIYDDNVKQCLEKIKPLAEILRSPLQKQRWSKWKKYPSFSRRQFRRTRNAFSQNLKYSIYVVNKLKNRCKNVHMLVRRHRKAAGSSWGTGSEIEPPFPQ